MHLNRFDGAWTGWGAVPGEKRTASAVGTSSIGIFARVFGDAIHANSFDGQTFGGWEEVPGGGRTFDAPAALDQWDDDHETILTIDLFVRGTDDRIYNTQFTPRTLTWTPAWLEVPPFTGMTPSAPSARKFGDDIYLFVRGFGDGLHVNRLGETGWTGWHEVPGGGRTPDAPDAAVFDGHLFLFVRGADNGIHYNRFDESTWLGWKEVPGGGKTPSAPTVTVWDEDLYVFVRGADDGIHYNRLFT